MTNHIVWGDQENWKLISSDADSITTAMQIGTVNDLSNGIVLRVTNNKGGEALTFVPFAIIIDVLDNDGKLIGRRLSVENVEVLPYE